jgi:CheY-like chemotaxis protein
LHRRRLKWPPVFCIDPDRKSVASILIIEDERAIIALLTRVLAQAGHVVASAANGAEGIVKIEREAPDLIIMDISMPRLNGLDAMRLLKASPATRRIPILALTSAVTAEDRKEAYQAGCDAYETKPFDLKRLMSRIEDLMRLREPAMNAPPTLNHSPP